MQSKDKSYISMHVCISKQTLAHILNETEKRFRSAQKHKIKWCQRLDLARYIISLQISNCIDPLQILLSCYNNTSKTIQQIYIPIYLYIAFGLVVWDSASNKVYILYREIAYVALVER